MDIKTLDGSTVITDPIYKKQKEGVAKMRTSLLACADDGGVSARQAIQNITAMRVYHQLMRIIKYLEMMDKLEAKLYESLDSTIENAETDVATMLMLISIQSKLQKNMIESHKLLEPYLNLQELTMMDLAPQDSELTGDTVLMKSEERDRLRSTAQAVLTQLKEGGGDG